MPAAVPSDDALARDLLAAGIRGADAFAGRLRGLAEQRAGGAAIHACCRAFAAALVDTPVPEAALANFERLLQGSDQPEAWARYLLDQPRALEILVKLFVGSQHLTDILLRQPELLRDLTQQKRLADVKSRDEFLSEARAASAGASDPLAALRGFQRRELLRIGAADTFSLLDLRAVTGQLSCLAEVMIDLCLETTAAAEGRDATALAVLALGKLGGRELNYSSDIDLIFLSDKPDATIVRLAQRLVRALQESTDEGFLYRVDLRLRPWGSSGPLVTSPSAFLAYLSRHAALWERQALLKARAAAGDAALGTEFLRAAEPYVFRGDDPAALRAGIRESKLRIEAEAGRLGRAWGDVKSGKGSLRDIEFIVQMLQLRHGVDLPAVRTPNTLDGLVRLADFDCIHADEYRLLTDGYIFLRTVEHALQLVHNQQRHAVPTERHELSYLARRLDFPDAETFLLHYERHVDAVRAIYRKYLELQTPTATVPPPPPVAAAVPRYETCFSPDEQRRHRLLLAETSPSRPVRVAVEPAGTDWRVTVAGDDRPGDLSMTCGLFFVYGFDVLEGFVSTAIHAANDGTESAGRRPPDRRVFVNTFLVRPPYVPTATELWVNYEADLNELFLMARTGADGAAQGKLAKRVAAALVDVAESPRRLSPMQIEFDNASSDACTVLRLRADDSLGFLYELTNALALCDIDIKAMLIRTQGARIEDTLLVTDARGGGKILSEKRLRELNAAIVLIKHFTHLLPHAPNPEAALLHFRGFIAELFRQPNWVDELASLERPDVLDALARILGVSDFLWDDLLRLQYASLFPLLKNLSGLEAPKSRRELEAELDAELRPAADRAERRRRLNAFKDREMFRVDMRHILGKISRFQEFAEELADIVELVVCRACDLCLAELTERFGTPRTEAGDVCRYVVAALGKCGGRELGYASDIELMFVYEGDGFTDGQERIPNADFFVKLVESFMGTIQARQEGIFHVDLRLRPHGRSGPLAASWTAFERYFGPSGAAWPFERQALVKLRPIAGDVDLLGRRLVELRDRLIYAGQPVDHVSLQALRERQVRQLVRAGTFHAKLSPGGLVDIEYFVQALQLEHGHESTGLRVPATAAAADALHRAGYLSASDHARLQAAYWFFRRLIDALRVVRGNARDLTVPNRDSEEFEFLARRLGYGGDSSRLQADLDRHRQSVLALLRPARAPSAVSPTQTSPIRL
jgi:glutamate-ammonia-ligase adenylyltransferase